MTEKSPHFRFAEIGRVLLGMKKDEPFDPSGNHSTDTSWPEGSPELSGGIGSSTQFEGDTNWSYDFSIPLSLNYTGEFLHTTFNGTLLDPNVITST